MRILSTLILAALFGTTAHAQGVITRIGSDGTHFYYNGVSDLQNVFDHATQNGLGKDTILMSGGVYNLELLPNSATVLSISSPVVVVGTGIRADSSVVYGGMTEFIGYGRRIVLSNDADSTEMHGVTFNTSGNSYDIWLGSNLADSDVDHLRFFRCNIRGLVLGYIDNNITLADNILIEECVIGSSLNVQQSNMVVIRNSSVRFLRSAGSASNVDVRNCIIPFYSGGSLAGNEGVNYLNTVFLTNSTNLNVSENSVYTRCLFVGNGQEFPQNLTFNSGIVETATMTATSLAVAFPGVPSPAGYAEHQFNGDYTIALPYLGTDDTPLGLYGGDAPWKDGSLPFNPHWSLLTTHGNTSNGVLQGVHIKASAQEN